MSFLPSKREKATTTALDLCFASGEEVEPLRALYQLVPAEPAEAGFDALCKLLWMCADEPAFGAFRDGLSGMVRDYVPNKSVPVLFLSGCGYLTALEVKLVPDWGICCELAKDHTGRDSLQLNIDTKDD